MPTLVELAEFIGADYKGDAHCSITGIATLEKAKPGELSFLSNSRYRHYLQETQASAVILSPSDLDDCPTNALVMDNPYLGYAKAASQFTPKPIFPPGIHSSAVIHEQASIHSTAHIGPHVVIGPHVTIGSYAVIQAGCTVDEGSTIGSHTQLYPKVTLYKGVKIGQRTIIHSGVVIGSDGFGFASDNNIWHKIPQLGGVTIGDDVEIGANTVIDRGALEDTVIAEGVKLDNQIQIGHNVKIGAHSIIAGCTGISGSTHIGEHCMIGGFCQIGGHLEITDHTILTGGSGVSSSITKPGVYSSGIALSENKVWRKNVARFRQLDEIVRRFLALEKKMENL